MPGWSPIERADWLDWNRLSETSSESKVGDLEQRVRCGDVGGPSCLGLYRLIYGI